MVEYPKGRTTGAWLSWLIAVAGWLICAALALMLSIGLERWPDAYDLFLPAILFVLFFNILVYLFVTTRLAMFPFRLAKAVSIVCLTEALLFFILYLLGRFTIGQT